MIDKLPPDDNSIDGLCKYYTELHDVLSRKFENIDITDLNYTLAEMIRNAKKTNEEQGRGAGRTKKETNVLSPLEDRGYAVTMRRWNKTYTMQTVNTHDCTVTSEQDIWIAALPYPDTARHQRYAKMGRITTDRIREIAFIRGTISLEMQPWYVRAVNLLLTGESKLPGFFTPQNLYDEGYLTNGTQYATLSDIPTSDLIQWINYSALNAIKTDRYYEFDPNEDPVEEMPLYHCVKFGIPIHTSGEPQVRVGYSSYQAKVIAANTIKATGIISDGVGQHGLYIRQDKDYETAIAFKEDHPSELDITYTYDSELQSWMSTVKFASIGTGADLHIGNIIEVWHYTSSPAVIFGVYLMDKTSTAGIYTKNKDYFKRDPNDVEYEAPWDDYAMAHGAAAFNPFQEFFLETQNNIYDIDTEGFILSGYGPQSSTLPSGASINDRDQAEFNFFAIGYADGWTDTLSFIEYLDWMTSYMTWHQYAHYLCDNAVFVVWEDGWTSEQYNEALEAWRVDFRAAGNAWAQANYGRNMWWYSSIVLDWVCNEKLFDEYVEVYISEESTQYEVARCSAWNWWRPIDTTGGSRWQDYISQVRNSFLGYWTEYGDLDEGSLT